MLISWRVNDLSSSLVRQLRKGRACHTGAGHRRACDGRDMATPATPGIDQELGMVFVPSCLICPHMDGSENRVTPKSSILIGFSIINNPFWGTLIFGNTHIDFKQQHSCLVVSFGTNILWYMKIRYHIVY